MEIAADIFCSFVTYIWAKRIRWELGSIYLTCWLNGCRSELEELAEVYKKGEGFKQNWKIPPNVTKKKSVVSTEDRVMTFWLKKSQGQNVWIIHNKINNINLLNSILILGQL